MVLAEAGLTPAQLDILAFGRGPGSFTGVRIAAGVAQGIALAADLPVAPISTLAAMALRTMGEYQVEHAAVAIDARMGEVYWGAYRGQGQGVELLGREQVCAPDVAPLPEAGLWIGAGSGWAAYGDVLSRRGEVPRWWGDCYPRAADIAVLGALAWRRRQVVNAEGALPVYLRDQVTNKPANHALIR